MFITFSALNFKLVYGMMFGKVVVHMSKRIGLISACTLVVNETK